MDPDLAHRLILRAAARAVRVVALDLWTHIDDADDNRLAAAFTRLRDLAAGALDVLGGAAGPDPRHAQRAGPDPVLGPGPAADLDDHVHAWPNPYRSCTCGAPHPDRDADPDNAGRPAP